MEANLFNGAEGRTDRHLDGQRKIKKLIAAYSNFPNELEGD